jgi:uncharacterized protein YdiU (UPF0061 family)
MHFLGVPTTRALSLVATGDDVIRDLFYDGNPRAEPGAIVCRVSPSFLRFGNFEILSSEGEIPLLEKLTQLLIHDHFPELDLDPHTSASYGRLLDEIARRTARMVVDWMRVGFVHGVMNTDNMSVLGLTIDYGPYGWLEPYEPNWTPNTTDAQGRRYCFGNQPGIAQWNLARLCEAFYPLIRDEARLHETLAVYKNTIQEAYSRMMAEKTGLSTIGSKEDETLIQDMFQLLQSAETDFTIFFRALSDFTPESVPFLQLIAPAFYASGTPDPSLTEAWTHWSTRYASRIELERGHDENSRLLRSARMKKINPKYVLRNYLAQNAIQAAESGDLSVLERLARALKTPYDESPGNEDLAAKRPEWARNAPGCSALSCSS